MERKIGEIFEYNGGWYQCVEHKGCRSCAFALRHGTGIRCGFNGDPHCDYRSDGKLVIFKKLEKVGEPFSCDYYGDSPIMMQEYNLYNLDDVTNEDNIPMYITDYRHKRIAIEIKQTKEDMEEKKDNYDGNMDKECIQICDALNSIPDVRTTESCCGHCKNRFMIFFTCDNPHSLAIIARVFDRRYIGTSQPWHIELQTKDSGAYNYFIHSETKYSSEEVMMKDVNKIIENIKYWCDDKFASHFKGCDDKPTLTPFDINLAKQGKPVCTRDGHKTRIICFDRKNNIPIVALIERADGIEILQCFYNDGKCFYDSTSDNDLMMLPEKKEGWILLRKDGCVFDNEEVAKKNCTDDYFVAKVEWEE